jgi:signal peptidase I
MRSWVRHTVRLVALAWLYLVALVVGAVLVLLVAGVQPILITSDSMAPTVRRSDLVLVAAPTPERLHPGAVITFHPPGERGRLTTHRIIEVTAEGNLVTRGDANERPDSSPVAPGDVVGVSRFAVPFAGTPVLAAREGRCLQAGAWIAGIIAAGLVVTNRTPRRPRPDGTPPPTEPGWTL